MVQDIRQEDDYTDVRWIDKCTSLWELNVEIAYIRTAINTLNTMANKHGVSEELKQVRLDWVETEMAFVRKRESIR